MIGGSGSASGGALIGNAFDDSSGLPTEKLGATDSDLTNPYLSPYTDAINQKKQAIDSQNEVNAMQRKFAYWPIFVSSLCFALVHWGQGLAPIPLFVLALGLGYLFRQTGSLIACITVHFLLNFYSMLVFTAMILLGETP